MNRRTLLLGTAASLIAAPLPTCAQVPPPLADLVIHEMQPGNITLDGRADLDLLLVAPPGRATGHYHTTVNGFRGVWLVGGHFDRAPSSNLVAPNGQLVVGTDHLLSVKSGVTYRPFVYLADLRIDTSRICYGDAFKFGGAARLGQWQAWPDVFMTRIVTSPGCIGWGGYYGGTAGNMCSHSDFRKADNGGWRNLTTTDCDLGWGFQCCFDVATFATGYLDYHGPDRATSHFARTVWRPLASHPNFPQAGEHKATALTKRLAGYEQEAKAFMFGEGCVIVPPQGHRASEFFAPQVVPSGISVQSSAPSPQAPRDVRIATRAQLVAYLG